MQRHKNIFIRPASGIFFKLKGTTNNLYLQENLL